MKSIEELTTEIEGIFVEHCAEPYDLLIGTIAHWAAEMIIDAATSHVAQLREQGTALERLIIERDNRIAQLNEEIEIVTAERDNLLCQLEDTW